MYDYQTKISLKSGGGRAGMNWFELQDDLIDETIFSSASDSLQITTSLKLAKIWEGSRNSLIRFKVGLIL